MQLDMNIRVELDGKEVNTQALLSINEADLSTEYATQAARFAWIAVLKAEAKRQWSEAERARKEEEAIAFKDYKNSTADIPPGSKSVSDGYAAQLVQLDPDCNELRQAENEAEYRYRILEALTKALELRGSMLISMGADLRMEREQTGLNILEDPGDALQNQFRSRKRRESR